MKATKYIDPAYHHIGLYENFVMIKPITGLSTSAHIAPAVPDIPITVDVEDFPNVSLIEVM